MLPYLFQPVGVADDLEVEAPVVVHAGLPQIAGYVVLFGAKPWMVEIEGKKSKLFRKAFRTAGGASSRASTRLVKSIFIDSPMRASFWLPAFGADWR